MALSPIEKLEAWRSKVKSRYFTIRSPTFVSADWRVDLHGEFIGIFSAAKKSFSKAVDAALEAWEQQEQEQTP